MWRWREAYQNDFAARMDWCIAAKREDANHHPVAVVGGDKKEREDEGGNRRESGARSARESAAEGEFNPDADARAGAESRASAAGDDGSRHGSERGDGERGLASAFAAAPGSIRPRPRKRHSP